MGPVNYGRAYMRTFMALLTAFLSSPTAAAQSPAAAPSAPTFEIASVQVSTPRSPRRSAAFRGRRFEAKGQTLASLIAFAYGVNADRVAGPNWLDSDRFDIAARTPSGSSPEQ